MSRGISPYYRQIKDEMKPKGIICADIAKATGLSLHIIQNWMGEPEEDARREIITRAIQHIIDCRERGAVIVSMRERLQAEGLFDRAKVRLPRKTETTETAAPRKARVAASSSVFCRYTKILPWKGRKVNDQRRAGDLCQKRGAGQD